MLKALSVRQPWASLIIDGPKRVENRSWFTDYRGQLFIHAPKTFDVGAFHELEDDGTLAKFNMPRKREGYPISGIIGVVTLQRVIRQVEHLPNDQRTWWYGPYGLLFADVRSVEFIPCPGQRRIFEWKLPT